MILYDAPVQGRMVLAGDFRKWHIPEVPPAAKRPTAHVTAHVRLGHTIAHLSASLPAWQTTRQPAYSFGHFSELGSSLSSSFGRVAVFLGIVPSFWLRLLSASTKALPISCCSSECLY